MVSPVKPLVALWRKPATRRNLGFGMFSAVGVGLGVTYGSWTRACAGQQCPSIAYLEEYRPVQSAKFYAADGRLIRDFGESRTVIALEEMSPAIPAAYLASEDKRFFQHNGVDMSGLFRQVQRGLLGKSLQGGSTISMQLARNVFRRHLPHNQRTVQRKLREIQVALELEKTYPKERILELYLNQIFLGGQIHGVEEAARRYFGKSAADVNVAEAALLAAITPLPNAYEPRRHPEIALRRRNTILNLMRDQGYLTPEEAEEWKAYPIEVSSREDFSSVAEYFVEWARKQLYARLGDDLFARGYRVYTTLDLDMQIAAERALEDRLREIESGYVRADLPDTRYEFPHQSYREYRDSIGGPPPESSFTPYLQGALITLDTNGYVRAMVGGRNFRESKFNRATQALRQPGSTFKPFTYVAAIRAGRPPSYIIDDAPILLVERDGTPWEPQNFEGNYKGPMPLRWGLRLSRNLVAIRLGQELGASTVAGEATRFGLSTPIPHVASLPIGSATVYPIEMVSAYTAFATLGVRAAPVGILRVEDTEGNIVWEPQRRLDRVMDPDRMWLATNMLQDVVNAGTAWRAVRVNGRFRHPAGGKTGTTNDGTDVWFIGFTRELVTGVWMGFDEPKKIMPTTAGGLQAAPAWTAFMNEVYSRRPAPGEWEVPPSLVSRRVDKTTGYLATQLCPRQETYQEWFVPGTEPTEECPIHPNPFRFGISGVMSQPPPHGNHEH